MIKLKLVIAIVFYNAQLMINAQNYVFSNDRVDDFGGRERSRGGLFRSVSDFSDFPVAELRQSPIWDLGIFYSCICLNFFEFRLSLINYLIQNK